MLYNIKLLFSFMSAKTTYDILQKDSTIVLLAHLITFHNSDCAIAFFYKANPACGSSYLCQHKLEK